MSIILNKTSFWRCGAILQFLIVIVFIVDFIVNLYADKNNIQKLKVLTKPLLVPLIILFYLTSAVQINWLIVSALFFGFLGDFSLLWGSKKIFFAIGLFAFLVGHSEKSYEYIVVLEGNLCLRTNESEYHLNKEDSICFASTNPHVYSNKGDCIMKSIIINYYPV